MRQRLATADLVIARIAARQHGVVTFAQLLGAGLSASGIARRVAAGRLHRIHRGVYAVGHAALSSEGRWFAAVATCGGGRSSVTEAPPSFGGCCRRPRGRCT
jgi:hypothetical protein